LSTGSIAPTHDLGFDIPPTVAAIKNPTSKIVYDEYNHERYPPGDPNKRAFASFVLTGGRFVYASLIRLLVLKFVLSMSASKDVLALASLEVDLLSIYFSKYFQIWEVGSIKFLLIAQFQEMSGEPIFTNLNTNIEKLPTRGPVSKYTLPDENEVRDRSFISIRDGKLGRPSWLGDWSNIEISFDEASSGVACNLESRGFHVLCQATKEAVGHVKPYSMTGTLPLIRELQDEGFDVQTAGYAHDFHQWFSQFRDNYGVRTLSCSGKRGRLVRETDQN
ncbi:cytochrome b-c1 complex subunit Rieske-4, mitochondrial, partial [Tanacetum coccineum]